LHKYKATNVVEQFVVGFGGPDGKRNSMQSNFMASDAANGTNHHAVRRVNRPFVFNKVVSSLKPSTNYCFRLLTLLESFQNDLS